MQEQTIPPIESTGPAAGAGIFDESSDQAGLAVVSSGVHVEQSPVGGMTVGEIRRRYADRFDIDPQSEAFIDGHVVGDDVVVRPGQTLMFSHQAGEKGRGPGLPGRVPAPLAA